MTTRTTTDKENKATTCAFPGCSTGLNSYSKKERFCSIHQRFGYQQLLAAFNAQIERIKSLEAEKLKLEEELTAKRIESLEEDNDARTLKAEDHITGSLKAGDTVYETVIRLIPVRSGVYLTLGLAQANPPYTIEERGIEGIGKTRLLVGANVTPRITFLDREPDLFIRFAELPEEEEAYISFISKYGFLGLRDLCRGSRLRWCTTPGPGHDYEWEANAEPLLFIRLFHVGFKDAFEMAKDFVEGKQVEAPAERCLSDIVLDSLKYRAGLENWLIDNLQTNVTPFINGLRGGLVLSAKNLAGALTLQLYRFILVGKMLKECQLPGCPNLTARKRFCSPKHQKLFNSWKLRGNIVLIDGAWKKVDKPRKRRTPGEKSPKTTVQLVDNW